MSIKKPSLESLKVADEIINYVTKGKNTLTIDQLKSSKIFPKAEMIYYTIKMISESDLKSLEYLKSAIDERIKIITSKYTHIGDLK